MRKKLKDHRYQYVSLLFSGWKPLAPHNNYNTLYKEICPSPSRNVGLRFHFLTYSLILSSEALIFKNSNHYIMSL